MLDTHSSTECSWSYNAAGTPYGFTSPAGSDTFARCPAGSSSNFEGVCNGALCSWRQFAVALHTQLRHVSKMAGLVDGLTGC
jgi:hypothetical protein